MIRCQNHSGNIIKAWPVQGHITSFIEEEGFHEQTSVGNVFCRILFVYELIFIFLLFSVIDNIFVRYRHRLGFSSGCQQTALHQKAMIAQSSAQKKEKNGFVNVVKSARWEIKSSPVCPCSYPKPHPFLTLPPGESVTPWVLDCTDS